LPYTTVVAGTTISASVANTNWRDQVITPFASTSARDSAITSPVNGMVCYTTDAAVLWIYNGTKWLRQQKKIYLGTQFQTVTTSFATVGNFSFTGDTGGVYAISSWMHTVAPTAADLSFQWSLPAGATVEWSLLGPASTDAGTNLVTTVYQGAITTTGPLTIGGMNSNGAVGQLIGTIVIGGTAGTCALQAAQLVASGTSFVRASSWLGIEQIG
jgi:hypothetical protein